LLCRSERWRLRITRRSRRYRVGVVSIPMRSPRMLKQAECGYPRARRRNALARARASLGTEPLAKLRPPTSSSVVLNRDGQRLPLTEETTSLLPGSRRCRGSNCWRAAWASASRCWAVSDWTRPYRGESEKVDRGYVGRILLLALLASDIVEAILDGRQPAELTDRLHGKRSSCRGHPRSDRRAAGVA
jgi:hypothetical protein